MGKTQEYFQSTESRSLNSHLLFPQKQQQKEALIVFFNRTAEAKIPCVM